MWLEGAQSQWFGLGRRNAVRRALRRSRRLALFSRTFAERRHKARRTRPHAWRLGRCDASCQPFRSHAIALDNELRTRAIFTPLCCAHAALCRTATAPLLPAEQGQAACPFPANVARSKVPLDQRWFGPERILRKQTGQQCDGRDGSRAADRAPVRARQGIGAYGQPTPIKISILRKSHRFHCLLRCRTAQYVTVTLFEHVELTALHT